MGFEAMIKGYEEWKKTPQGKEYKKKSKNYKAVEIKPLPEGWELEDGGIKDGYFVYYNYRLGIEIIVQEHWDIPCWAGGYPKLHYIGVFRKDDDDIEAGSDGIMLRKFSIHELGWDKAFSQANELALGEMESL